MPTLVIDDNFNRANTTAGAAGSTTGAGNGWIDKLGGVYFIASNALNGIPQGYPPNPPFLTNFLVRPDSENVRDEQVILDITSPGVTTDQDAIMLRYQSSANSFYMIKVNWASGARVVDIYKIVGGLTGTSFSGVSYQLILETSFTAFTAGHNYELQASAVGVSPTTLSYTLTDTTTSTVISSASATDSESSLQTTGAMGILINSATQPTMVFSRIRTYNASQTVIPVNDANLFLTGNWYVNGSTYAQSQNAGAYLKLGFTGTSIGINFDLSPLTGGSIASGNWPLVIWSIDGGAYSSAYQLTSGSSTLPLASGLASGTHSLEFMILATSRTDDRWNGPANCVRITGFNIDSGAASAAPTLRPRRLYYYGDSIGEGDLVFGSGYNTFNADVRYAPGFCLGYARNAEVTNTGFASQGWSIGYSASGNIPSLQTSWSMFDANHSRLASGHFASPPDDIVFCEGVNDQFLGQSDAVVTSSVSTVLAAARTAAPLASIFVVIPACGAKRSAITAGVNNYQTATPDAKCYLIDRGTTDQTGLTPGTGSASFASSDGTHPLAFENARLEAHTALLMQTTSSPVDSPGVTTLLTRISQSLSYDTNGYVKAAGQTLPPAPTGYGNSGTGAIAINQNTGGLDNLRYVNSTGQGIGGATIAIYLATDWPTNSANIQAQSTTGPDGRWLAPAYVNSGTYVAVFSKTGSDGPDVSAPFTV
jgi:hypothetical protein